MRTFETGATRNSDTGKHDYEGFLSPRVIEAYGEYMHSHRMQKDGHLRDSDNWQKGIPLSVFIKSAWRHFFDLWAIHRGHVRHCHEDGHQLTIKETCCAILFNVMGYLHEVLKNVDESRSPEIPEVLPKAAEGLPARMRSSRQAKAIRKSRI
jgi:hypothetical protein